MPEIIQDYIADKRPAETDEQGQSPLLTKGDQKISPSTLQKISYKWTRPCMVGIDCPHDRDPEDCEAAQKNNSTSKCPSSRAPHHIRKGYTTDQKTEVFRGMQSNTAVTFQTAFKTSTMTFLMTPKSVNVTKMNFGTQTKILILATITSENDFYCSKAQKQNRVSLRSCHGRLIRETGTLCADCPCDTACSTRV